MTINVNIEPKDVIRYVALPGIFPRLKTLFGSGFGSLAYLIAMLYCQTGLLPASHPYCQRAHIGRYGIRHVLAEAANRIVFKKENTDQIVIFSASLIGFVLLIMQFAACMFSLIFRPAHAFVTSFLSTPDPEEDIAFMMLDKVFGIPGLFESQFDPSSPPPFNAGLQAMFELYSTAILVVALVVFLYYIFVIVGETATSGTPFGQRFDHVWAPLRLVMAVGLLIPLGYGMNTGQYITLYAGKYGSSLATNAWISFNETLDSYLPVSNPTGEDATKLLAFPNAPDVSPIVAYMSLIRSCEQLYKQERFENESESPIKPYLVKEGGEAVEVSAGYSFKDAVEYYDGGNVLIRFGQKDKDQFNAETGYVKSFCGDVSIRVTSVSEDIGGFEMQEAYFHYILSVWMNPDNVKFAERVGAKYITGDPQPCDITGLPGDCKELPPNEWRQDFVNNQQAVLESELAAGWEKISGDERFALNEEILKYGWGGAGIWYNRIAELNGSFFAAVQYIPSLVQYPDVMQQVSEQKQRENANIPQSDMFSLRMGNNEPSNLASDEKNIAIGLNAVYMYWLTDGTNLADSKMTPSDNSFINGILAVFGAEGLFDLRENDARAVHPMAQLVGLGRALIDSTLQNLLYTAGFAAMGGFLGAVGQNKAGPIFDALSGAVFSIATITLVAGLILYYVLPFLPFIYFYFAVGAWIKTLLEAMVGVPLWALAHMRIDGKGLPADQASNGYFLILEIFIRPTLTVFGLIGAIVIFGAQARLLHDIFDIVIDNLTGFEEADPSVEIIPGVEGFSVDRGPIDDLFFTIMYVMIIYLAGIACFKLIDQVPNQILRWLGTGASSLGDMKDDPTESMVQYAAMGGATVGRQIASGVKEMGSFGGSVSGSLAQGAADIVAPRPSGQARNAGGGSSGGTGGSGSTGGGP